VGNRRPPWRISIGNGPTLWAIAGPGLAGSFGGWPMATPAMPDERTSRLSELATRTSRTREQAGNEPRDRGQVWPSPSAALSPCTSVPRQPTTTVPRDRSDVVPAICVPADHVMVSRTL
jgi:hypothetical protein